MDKKKLLQQIHDNELYYQSTDFTAEILTFKYRYGDIDIPEYQRDFEWDDAKQSQFIESLFLNLPAPSIFFIQKDKGILEVSDGSQRLRTLYNFLRGNLTLNGLEILTELNGVGYDELDLILQREIRNKPVKGYVFLNISKKMTEELFNRVNRQSSATDSCKIAKRTDTIADSIEAFGYAVEYGNMVDGTYGFISSSTKRVFVSDRKSKADVLRFLLFAEYMIRNYRKSVFANLEHALYVRDDLFCPIDEAILKDCTDYANRVFEELGKA